MREHRRRFQAQFPHAAVDVLTSRHLDQGSHGACGFVAFLTLCLLRGDKEPGAGIVKAEVMEDWESAWEAFGCGEGGFSDLGSMLDAMVAHQLFENSAEPRAVLQYNPIRSEAAGRALPTLGRPSPENPNGQANREMCFNEVFWVSPEGLCRRYGVTRGEYIKTPWVFQVAGWIEGLLDLDLDLDRLSGSGLDRRPPG